MLALFFIVSICCFAIWLEIWEMCKWRLEWTWDANLHWILEVCQLCSAGCWLTVREPNFTCGGFRVIPLIGSQASEKGLCEFLEIWREGTDCLYRTQYCSAGCSGSWAMAYNRPSNKKTNETFIIAAVCLAMGYLLCWTIQVPAKPKVPTCKSSQVEMSCATFQVLQHWAISGCFFPKDEYIYRGWTLTSTCCLCVAYSLRRRNHLEYLRASLLSRCSESSRR